MTAAARRPRRWQLILLGVVGLLLVLCLVFDWNWVRHPVERYVSKKTERAFTMSDLAVDLGWSPTIKMRDVVFANAAWSDTETPMAQIGSLEFSVSLRDLWDGKVLVPRVAMADARLLFEKDAEGRKNWLIKEPSKTTSESSLRISSLSVQSGHLRYVNHGEPMTVDIDANTFDPATTSAVTKADARPRNTAYTTRYAFNGKYHDAAFAGEALTGDVLSFQESGIPFPIKGSLHAGTTKASLEGTVADVVNISAIDMRLEMEGATLASLYPFLLLPLPASPPYALRGHLVKLENRFSMDDLNGKIGETDIRGSAAYLQKQPRPLLTAKLDSKLLKLSDLGPLIGLETKNTAGTPGAVAKPTQADTATRSQAQAKERQTSGDRVLPTGLAAAQGDGILPRGKFDGRRISAIDADVDYAAARLDAPAALPVENMKFSFHLHDAVAKLAPLEFGFAGGSIVSDITIDARQEKQLRSIFNADFRHIQVAKLFPSMPKLAQGAGEMGAQIRLSGNGSSIADAAGNADGNLTVAIANGRISNLLDAAAGLNGGKVISLLIGGDRDIKLNCGAAAFGVKDGLGTSQLFVVDTEQTRVDGSGVFNLKDEQFSFTVEPKPKKPGILSLRTPLYLYGSFRHPQYGLDKRKLLLRIGSAIALDLINPLAAVLPLVETGSGSETNCAQLLAPVRGAEQQALSTKLKAPVVSGPPSRKPVQRRSP